MSLARSCSKLIVFVMVMICAETAVQACLWDATTLKKERGHEGIEQTAQDAADG